MLRLKLWWCNIDVSASTTERPWQTVEATKISVSTLFLSCSTQKLPASSLSSHIRDSACPWVFLVGSACKIKLHTACKVSLKAHWAYRLLLLWWKHTSWKWDEQGAWPLSSHTGTDFARGCLEQDFLTGESFLGHSQCQRKSRKAWYSWEIQGEGSVQVILVGGVKEHFWLKVSSFHQANCNSQIPPAHILLTPLFYDRTL